MEFQGSDGYLKKQWRLIAKGELGYIPAKHIVSALPEEGERPSSTHKKITVDGWDREDEEEVRSHPTSRRQLERLHQTFRTTLLMCTAALPQFGNLKVTKAELDNWYDWFYGEDIAGRRPPSTRWCTRAPPSPMPSRISGATSSSGNERSMSTSTGRRRRGRTRARHLRCGRLSGRSRRRGGKAPGPRGRPGPSRRARAARGSPPTPPQFHGRTTGLSRIPKGWRTAEISTSTTSARDRAAVPTTARSGRMGGCVMPPHRSMRHRHALTFPSTFPSDRRPLRIGPVASQSQLGSQATSARVHTEGESGEAVLSDEEGLLQGATGPSTEEEERSQPGHSRRAEASLSPAPTEAVGRPPRETQR